MLALQMVRAAVRSWPSDLCEPICASAGARRASSESQVRCQKNQQLVVHGVSVTSLLRIREFVS